MAEGYRGSRLPLILAAIASIVWLGLAGSVLVRDLPGEAYDILALLALLQLAGTMLAGPAAFFALAAAILAARRAHAAHSFLDDAAFAGANAIEALEDAEARLTGIVTRVNAVREVLASDMETFAQTASGLTTHVENAGAAVSSLRESSQEAHAAGERLATLVPTTMDAANRLQAALRETGEGMERESGRMDMARQSLLTDTRTLGETGDNILKKLGEGYEALHAQATQSQTASTDSMKAMSAEADALLEKCRQATAHMNQVILDAEERLNQLGGDTARDIALRLETLVSGAASFDHQLKAQIQQTEALAATAERTFQLLDARITHNETTSKAVLERLSGRVAQLSGSVDGLFDPLKAGKIEIDQLDIAVSGLRATISETIEALGQSLPSKTEAAKAATHGMAQELRALMVAIDDAQRRAQELIIPIQESRATIDEAALGYARQREAIAIAAEALVVELNQARLLIAEVEQQTETTSLAAATRLVDAMARVRDVATQTSTTVRSALDGVIDNARDSLSQAAFTAMQQNFSIPIAEQAQLAEQAAAQAADTARQAAERTAASMTALAGTLKRLDQRIESRLLDMETAAQQDMLASAQLLTDRLAAHSITLAASLGKPMTDTDWAQWRKGERGMFNRRTLSLLDRKDARELKQLMGTDAEFAGTAQRYTAEFDALLKRIDPSDTSPLIPALLSSEYGRLAATLHEALEN